MDDDCDVFFKTVPDTLKEPKKVKFNDNIEITEYVKYDYVPCSRQRKKSSNADKETRTLQQLRVDMHWILHCKLGATRGRAMAMLMDSQYECRDVDEVHIVLGPKSDLKVRMKSDEDLEDDPRAELFEGDIKPHVPGKFGKKGNVMCITMPIELRDRRFIVDSGSGHDLISSNRKCYFVHDIFVMRARPSTSQQIDIYIYIYIRGTTQVYRRAWGTG